MLVESIMDLQQSRKASNNKENDIFLVTHNDSSHMSCVLSIHHSYEDAVSYLTTYLDSQYEPNISNKYRVVQKSRNLFEVYQNGYLYKTLVGKYQIIRTDLPN